ncbi:MAG: tRNA-dihydrouridine synthase B [Pseudohongiellaceae bacterium]
MIKIGPFSLNSRVVLAPMAGVTDLPFRHLCRSHGAALTPSEMITSNIKLWNQEKSRLRRCYDGEQEPRVVQIAGSDPAMMAEAARMNAEQGAQIIDINMGCPAKKVLKRSAGSALLQHPSLVETILKAVVASVDVPVSLKIRTGWDTQNRNGVDIARLAEDCGIQSLAVHGRTRACAFKGSVEYDTIAAIKDAISIPVFANGDIASPEQAAHVLKHTRADGLMIGRAAQGRPWIFNAISHYLELGSQMPAPTLTDVRDIMTGHVRNIHSFYGPVKGVFFARKHVTWYLSNLCETPDIDCSGPEFDSMILAFRKQFNSLQDCNAQLDNIESIFQLLIHSRVKQQQKELAA